MTSCAVWKPCPVGEMKDYLAKLDRWGESHSGGAAVERGKEQPDG